MSSLREKSLGLMIYLGGTVFIVALTLSVFLGFGLTIQAARFGSSGGGANSIAMGFIVLSGVGFVAMVSGIVMGLVSTRREYGGKIESIPVARVVARFALDANEVMHTTPESVEFAPKPKFYVRLDIGRGESIEFRCAEPVFWTAGEGMIGKVDIQGHWLGSFAPIQAATPHIANEFDGRPTITARER